MNIAAFSFYIHISFTLFPVKPYKSPGHLFGSLNFFLGLESSVWRKLGSWVQLMIMMIITLWGVLACEEQPLWPPCWGRRTRPTPAFSALGPSDSLCWHRSSGSCNWQKDPRPHGCAQQWSLWNCADILKLGANFYWTRSNWEGKFSNSLSLDWLLI